MECGVHVAGAARMTDERSPASDLDDGVAGTVESSTLGVAGVPRVATKDRKKRGFAALGVAGALLCVLLALALWLVRGNDPAETSTSGVGSAGTSPPSLERVAPMPRQAAAARRIADQGRLRVSRETLRDGEVLALELELARELRGTGPRRVRVVDAGSGRVLDTVALPLRSTDGGLGLDLDPAWLRPGRYLIEVEIVGGGPFPLRRYVLEVD